MSDSSIRAAESIAGDLLNALVRELKTMPDIWVRVPEDEQTEILDRLRQRVTNCTRQAVKLIVAADRLTVAGELKRVTFSDKIEAVFAFSKQDPSAMELCRAQGLLCLITTADATQFLGGVDETKADSNQPDLPGVDSGSQVIEQARRRSKRKPPPEDGAIDPLH